MIPQEAHKTHIEYGFPVIRPGVSNIKADCLQKFSCSSISDGVVDRRIYTRIFQFPLRINVKISEHAQNFNVFKPRLVCRRILILPSGSSGNSQKSEILKNLKFSKIRNSQKSEILKNHKFSKI